MNSYRPTIDATGAHADDFATVRGKLEEDYRTIFGADAYIPADAQDGQLIGVHARGIADCNAAFLAVYNAFSPATAQGNGLSSNVKINGLQRASPSSSTCDVTIVGVAGITITNGQVTDANTNTWLLPTTVTIPQSGQITVTATCSVPGSIAAAPGTLTRIRTPVYGWQTVTNAAASALGQPVETDAALRARQSQSVASPSTTILDGVMAAIASPAVNGVRRKRAYENSTNATDANGIPAKNVAILVEGGDSLAIATVIARKITPGTPTLGTISNTIISPRGSSRVVNFSRPTDANIYVELTVRALTGWSTTIQPIIAQAVVDYLNTLPIGETVDYFDLTAPPKILGSPYASAFKLQGMRIKQSAGGVFGTTNLVLGYNEAPKGSIANVTFIVV
jgi:uncharacterized phage protein gp47/JayE